VPARPDEPADSLPSGFLPPNEVLGRYVVLYRLGTGGMGIVYAAYDPKLDRKVALKLLRRLSSDPDKRQRAQERLLEEARAMARLSHANVITVHDVAVVDGRVVVAMEFVDGNTLTSALVRGDLDWRKVLDLMRKAGRGLASAHEAGLVHRDFKPDNVMLAKDGRVLVMDFGLARALDTDLSAQSLARMQRAEVADARPTEGGTPDPGSRARSRIVGTPAYMAPEQHRGKQVDGRTDQFSFCVTLYEALYGHRPFQGDNAPEILAQIESGRMPDPPAHTKVPSWVRAVVVRGLAANPEHRYASMHELIGALDRHPSARKRRFVVGFGAVGLVGLGGVGAIQLVHQPADPVCDGGEARLSGVWDAARKSDVQRRFLGTGKPYAEASWRAVASALDGYTDRWLVMHRDACEATKVRGEQSGELLDLRMECLGRRLKEVRALIGLFAEADAELVRTGVSATGKLVPVSVCADADLLKAPVPMPEDPQTRIRIEDVREQLAHAKAHEDAGRYARGTAIATTAVERARKIGYMPLLADALLRSGRLAVSSGDAQAAETALREALHAAAVGHDDQTAASALITLVMVMGHARGKWDRAEELAEAARAAVERVGSPPDLQAQLGQAVGALELQRGRYEKALAHFEVALERQREAVGDADPTMASFYNNVAITLIQRQDHARARQYLDKALAIMERTRGQEHPAVAAMVQNLGIVLLERGDTRQARRLLERAIAVWKAADAEHEADIAAAWANLGYAAMIEGDDAAAEGLFRRALAVWERQEPKHPNVFRALGNLGTTLQQQGRHGEAMEVIERAISIADETLDADSSERAYVMTDLGLLHLARGERQAAIEVLTGALQIRLERPGPPPELPRVRFALAEALVDSDRERALELARTARAGYAAMAEEHPLRRKINEVDSWIAQQGAVE
jgi:tetratricopeptide (TPR) repeat protein